MVGMGRWITSPRPSLHNRKVSEKLKLTWQPTGIKIHLGTDQHHRRDKLRLGYDHNHEDMDGLYAVRRKAGTR